MICEINPLPSLAPLTLIIILASPRHTVSQPPPSLRPTPLLHTRTPLTLNNRPASCLHPRISHRRPRRDGFPPRNQTSILSSVQSRVSFPGIFMSGTTFDS